MEFESLSQKFLDKNSFNRDFYSQLKLFFYYFYFLCFCSALNDAALIYCYLIIFFSFINASKDSAFASCEATLG